MKSFWIIDNDLNYEKDFLQDQELIWDYGKGYEVVVFLNKTKRFSGNWIECKMLTGISKGKVVILNKNEIKTFSNQNFDINLTI